MTAAQVLTQAMRGGVELSAAGGNLRWRCRGDLPEGLRALLVAHKDELLALLDVAAIPEDSGGQAEASRGGPPADDDPPDEFELEAWVQMALLDWHWPPGLRARRRLGLLADAIDAAYLARDLPRLRQAVAEALEVLRWYREAPPDAPPDAPPEARLFYQDGDGRPCGRPEAALWTWSGAPAWYRAAEHAPP
jgi:hypothetical protein